MSVCIVPLLPAAEESIARGNRASSQVSLALSAPALESTKGTPAGKPSSAANDEARALELARRARLPYVDWSSLQFDPFSGRLLKPELALRHACAPFSSNDSTLWLAASSPLDSETRRALEFASNRKVTLAIAPAADVHTLQTRLYKSEQLWKAYLARLAPRVGRERYERNTRNGEAHGSPGGGQSGAAELLGLLFAHAATQGAQRVQLHVEHSFTTVQLVNGSSSHNAFLWPGWVGSLTVAWCATASSSKEKPAVLAPRANTPCSLHWQVEHFGSAKTLTIEAVAPTSPGRVLPMSAQHAQNFPCPRCGEPAGGLRTSVCSRCKFPIWRICRKCGGRLHVSETVCPCCGAAATPAPAAPAAAPLAPTGPLLRTRPVGAPPTKLHVLVVDDQADVRHCMVTALAQLDVRVTAVDSGEEALRLAESDPPHLVVLDIVMPGMDGFEVMQRLRASLTTLFVPILAVTVLDLHDPRMRESLGPDDICLQKPFARLDLQHRATRLARLAYGIDLGPRATKIASQSLPESV